MVTLKQQPQEFERRGCAGEAGGHPPGKASVASLRYFSVSSVKSVERGVTIHEATPGFWIGPSWI